MGIVLSFAFHDESDHFIFDKKEVENMNKQLGMCDMA